MPPTLTVFRFANYLMADAISSLKKEDDISLRVNINALDPQQKVRRNVSERFANADGFQQLFEYHNLFNLGSFKTPGRLGSELLSKNIAPIFEKIEKRRETVSRFKKAFETQMKEKFPEMMSHELRREFYNVILKGMPTEVTPQTLSLRFRDCSVLFADETPADAQWEKDRFEGQGFTHFGCFALVPKAQTSMPDTIALIFFTYDKSYKPTSWQAYQTDYGNWGSGEIFRFKYLNGTVPGIQKHLNNLDFVYNGSLMDHAFLYPETLVYDHTGKGKYFFAVDEIVTSYLSIAVMDSLLYADDTVDENMFAVTFKNSKNNLASKDQRQANQVREILDSRAVTLADKLNIPYEAALLKLRDRSNVALAKNREMFA